MTFCPDDVVDFGSVGGKAVQLAIEVGHEEGRDDYIAGVRLVLDGQHQVLEGVVADLVWAEIDAKGLDAFGVRRRLAERRLADEEAGAEDYSFDRRLELACGSRGAW